MLEYIRSLGSLFGEDKKGYWKAKLPHAFLMCFHVHEANMSFVQCVTKALRADYALNALVLKKSARCLKEMKEILWRLVEMAQRCFRALGDNTMTLSSAF